MVMLQQEHESPGHIVASSHWKQNQYRKQGPGYKPQSPPQ